jgi:2TM domain
MTGEGSSNSREKHVKAVRDFYYHLMTYVFVMALLVIVDLRGGTGENAILGLDWAFWVMLFWGFGLAGHAISVFLGDHSPHGSGEDGSTSGSAGNR